MYRILILIALGYVCNMVIQGAVRKMLIDSKQVRRNYQGISIPNSMGIALVLSTVLSMCIMILFGYLTFQQNASVAFAGILMGFAGVIDDFAGNNQSKGFKGHIRNLIKGKLTTGGLKAVSGIVSSFIISLQISYTYYDLIINVLFISLLTNLMNLMDTRPGRAIKFFCFLSIIFLFAGAPQEVYYIVLGAVLSYLPSDLKAKGMLGDTGANFIGMITGAAIIGHIESSFIRIFLLLLVFALNLVSEKYSFSKIIEENYILSYIDRLGRRH
ncbi:MAG: UDP-N-acetylmuramyl pentapeptide phosphotransferase [Clostridia bacterium]